MDFHNLFFTVGFQGVNNKRFLLKKWAFHSKTIFPGDICEYIISLNDKNDTDFMEYFYHLDAPTLDPVVEDGDYLPFREPFEKYLIFKK